MNVKRIQEKKKPYLKNDKLILGGNRPNFFKK